MKRGERALITIKPSYAFKHPASGLPLPPGLRRDETVTVEAVVSGSACLGPGRAAAALAGWRKKTVCMGGWVRVHLLKCELAS